MFVSKKVSDGVMAEKSFSDIEVVEFDAEDRVEDGACMEALVNTALKKRWNMQADDLPRRQVREVIKGDRFPLDFFLEPDARLLGGHCTVQIGYDAGRWYAYMDHWKFPWMEVVEEAPGSPPSLEDIDWANNRCPVSRFFNVGEVIVGDSRRRPLRDDGGLSVSVIRQRIVDIARHLDDIREWAGVPIGVNSWYRPWAINREIGSRAPNHPGGYAVDFRPLSGSVWELQNRFKREWYDQGKWTGGFGLGARKGFLHLDLRKRGNVSKVVWTY
jgi:hypothetical protein